MCYACCLYKRPNPKRPLPGGFLSLLLFLFPAIPNPLMPAEFGFPCGFFPLFPLSFGAVVLFTFPLFISGMFLFLLPTKPVSPPKVPPKVPVRAFVRLPVVPRKNDAKSLRINSHETSFEDGFSDAPHSDSWQNLQFN